SPAFLRTHRPFFVSDRHVLLTCLPEPVPLGFNQPRHYDDKAAEAAQGFWNCPCVPMRERKECHCMLFLTPDNDFAGEDQAISLEEIKEATSKY
uniref:Ferredoxin-thioredoxin reductase catalytic chain, chloroplastic n=1 Tax=Aegilops tauschii subsp. strangulata TaxID=200361 RepID=A0A453MNV2_AEGTS